MEKTTLPHDHGHSFQKEEMPSLEQFRILSDVFKQLSDPTRVRIFWILCHYKECVINLSAMMDMSSPAVSHHLRQLKNSGLILSRRSGKEVYYCAAETAQAQLLHRMIEETLEISCPKSEEIDKR